MIDQAAINSTVVKFAKLLVLVLLISFYYSFLLEVFDRTVITWIISPIYKNKLNGFETVVTLLLTFYTLYLIAIKLGFPKYIVSDNTLVFLIIPFIVYINERLFSDRYEFTKILYDDKNQGLTFLDFPFGLLGITIITLIANKVNRIEVGTKNDLTTDLPIISITQDEYFRDQVYASLINQIVNINPVIERSLNIGIVNNWASGKTSFLNLLEHRLKENQDQTIIIKFDAWYSSGSAKLTKDFFDTLDTELSKYIYTGSLIRRYANNLTQINSVFNPIKYFPQHLINDEPNKSYFIKISNLLKKLGKRIFIIIDDIDRLNNKEAFNVLRLIRNSANFPFVIFVVPFDKEYIIHSLISNDIYRPKEYLKKIFDVELSLTPISETYLQPIFSLTLSDFISNNLENANLENVESMKHQVDAIFTDIRDARPTKNKYRIIRANLFKILKNKRDINRFLNSLKLSLKYNFKYLYLPDLIILELIKYQDNRIYRKLFENKDYLISKDSNGRKVLSLYQEGLDQDDATLIEIISRIREPYDIRKLGLKEVIIELVTALFAEPIDGDYNSQLSIYFDFNYLNYFQYNINGVTYEDLDSLVNGSDEN